MLISSSGQFQEFCSTLEQSDLNVLSHPLELQDGGVLLAVYNEQLARHNPWVVIWLPHTEIVRAFREYFPWDDSLVVVHGLKAWLRFFTEAGKMLLDSPNFRCTRLLGYLLDPPEKAEEETEADPTLEALVRRYLKTDYPSWGLWLQDHTCPEGLYKRLWEDARFTYLLWQKLTKKIHPKHDKEFLSLYQDIELPMARVLLDMEINGVRVDKEAAVLKIDSVKRELEKTEEQITRLIGSWVNPNSHLQVRPFLSWLQGEPFTGAISDETLRDFEDRHPAISLMLEYRLLSRDKSFLEIAGNAENDRVYPHYHQCRIATGRVSCTDPSLQNMRRDLRETYLLPEPGHLLVEADYKQAEARLLAYFSQDQELCDILANENLDIFEQTASELNRKNEFTEITFDRTKAKLLFYSVTYGASASKLAGALKIEEDLADWIINAFKNWLYPGVGRLIDRVRELLVEQGRKGRYVETPWGRRRMFDRRLISLYDLKHPSEPKDPASDPEVRRAFNFLLQGSVADLIKHVQVRLDRIFKEKSMQSRVILNLHDGLYLTVPPEEYSETERIVREAMESDEFIERLQEFVGEEKFIIPNIVVPLKAEIKILL